MDLPVVYGVAPELSVGAEVVRRHAGYETRVVLVIEQEQVGVGPNVARIRRNEKGQVTNQAHALGMRVFFESFALPKQQILSKADLLDLFRQLNPSPSQCYRNTVNQVCRPLQVICAVVSQLQRAEKTVIIEPMGFGVRNSSKAVCISRRAPCLKLVHAVSSRWRLNGMTKS